MIMLRQEIEVKELGLDLASAVREAQSKVLSWVESLIAGVPNFLAALLILLLFWIAGRLIHRIVHRVMARVSDHPAVINLVASAAYLLALATGLFLALGVLNLDKTVTSLLAGAGILGLAVGLAFQSIAENFLAGVLMATRRPFRVGDVLGSNDFMGVVERLDMRATVLRSFTGQEVRIPNSKVFNDAMVNYSDRGARRVDLEVGVTYGEDLEQVRRVAIAAVEGVEPRLSDRPVELFYSGFGDSSIDFQVRFWIAYRRETDYLAARSDAVMRIKSAFDANDITIPFPIRTLDFGPVGGTVLRDAWPAERRAG